MSASRPTRTSRRVASRRSAVLDSEDEERNTTAASTIIKSEADSASLLSETPRRRTRGSRRSVAPIAAGNPPARPRGRPRKTLPPDILPKVEDETSENAPQDEEPNRGQPEASLLSSTPHRRESAVPRVALAATPSLAPQTTTPLKSHDAPSPAATPLADITATSVNVRSAEEIRTAMKPVKPFETIMDKPIDIMLKQRTVAIPTIEEPSTPKSRIVLTHLIMNNFKSYAGRQEVGPFHASFSSVVGPNGSGKSNVIDSLLFVFGFRASKMRQGKISALIHNSSQHPNLDHCEVEVHFQEVIDQVFLTGPLCSAITDLSQPGGTHEVVPESKIIISRKAFRNNSSKYYINGKESNFTTVTTLLRERGVDLDHKRFLILQGEVESIAQMKAKAANEHDDGLLEYLEDIIGTSKYKSPIEETAMEVETLNEVCMEKSGRVQHVEKEKQSLEEKKEKALAYVKDENELTMKQSALYQIHLRECSDKALVTEEAIAQIQGQLDEELAKHQGSEEVIKKLGKEFSLGSKDLEAREKQAENLAKDLGKFEQERVKFEEKRKFLESKTKKLGKSIADAEGATAEADETIEQCQQDIQTRAKENASLEEQVKMEEIELAKIRESLKGKTQVYSDQIAAKQKQLEPWTEKINQKQAAISIAESEMKILQDKANAGAVALEELTAKMAAIEESRTAKAQELASCEEEKAALSKEAQKMESELQVLAEQEPKMRTKISHARQKADEARSSLASTQARGNVLTALLRMKESGRIDGFHGRLGNLGTIDSKYDIAISTACPSLDNFVTDTVEAGQQCIEYLRKNNLGRGNFVCLDRLRARDTSPITTPENAPRLFDLVRTKEDRFRPAFYHAMQDTLVAADLTQANRIAYGAKRWRVVTLAGELIDKSGTMSGGGTTVKKGLMSSKIVADVSKEQIAKLESDQEGWETKFQEFQEYQRECEGKLKKLNERLPQLDTKMQKIRLEMESAAKNMVDIERRIKEVSKEQQPSSSDSSRISALQKEITALRSAIEQLHGETASVNEEIQALQSKIMEVGGERLRAQRSKVDELKAEMSSHNDEISASEVRKVKAEKHKQKLSRELAKAETELGSAAKDLEKLEGDICNQGDKAEDLQNRVATAQEDAAAKKRDLAAFKKELDEKTVELNASRAVEIEMRNKLEESQKALVENRKRLAYWDEKLSKLALHNIGDLLGGPAPPPADDTTSSGHGEASTGERVEHEGPEGSDEDVDMTDAPSAHVKDEEQSVVHSMNDLPRYTPDELADMSKEILKDEIEALEERIQNVSVDLAVLAEYRRRVEEHASRSLDLQSAISRRDAAKKRCDDLRRSRLEGFMEGFSAISLRLKEMYQMITMGGNAELELVDSLDPFSEGILFSVMPPKKSWKNISNLSGGEKTLSSLALVFALHHYKPTPLYVMDEIDAALDFRNVSIVANYIKERTKNAQFIVISLRNNMFELAARLVGVYKVNHMTKSVTIENKEFIARPLPPQRPVGNGLTTTLALR